MKYQIQTRQGGGWRDEDAPYPTEYEATKAVSEMVTEGEEHPSNVRIVAVAAIIEAPASDEWAPDLAQINGVAAIIEDAVKQCEKTLNAAVTGKSGKTIAEVAKDMVEAYAKIGVSKSAIEKRIGHRIDSIQPAEITRLREIYASINDGFSGPEEWFDSEDGPSADNTADILNRVAQSVPDAADADKPARAKKTPPKAQADKPAEPQQSAPAPGLASPETIAKIKALADQGHPGALDAIDDWSNRTGMSDLSALAMDEAEAILRAAGAFDPDGA